MTKRYLIGKPRRKIRNRAKILIKRTLPRLSVFRSSRYLYAQIIDDKVGKTKTAVSTVELKGKSKNRIEQAKLAGKLLAEKSLKVGIKKVVFDRGAYKFHGRIKALAEGAREGGLNF